MAQWKLDLVKPVSTRLEQDVYDRVVYLAKKERRSVANMVRWLILEALEGFEDD